MVEAADPNPAHRKELAELRRQLSQQVPEKKLGRNLLIATWNIREFGRVTERWESGPKDVPKRNLHDLACITEVVSRFDVVAVQEIQSNIKALRQMMSLLGPNWAFILTDITRGAKPGQEERLGFVFDLRRVRPSGLAAELVVPPAWEVDREVLAQQFARTPYGVAFQAAGQTFLLVTLHVLYGNRRDQRTDELQKFADWLASWAEEIETWGQNLIALGDFNIDKRGDDPNFEAFQSRGLRTPSEIQQFPSTIFSDVKHYDQIAWFTGEGEVPKLRLGYGGTAGYFDFTKAIAKAREKSFRMSDHFPLWTEFLIPQE